MKPRGQRSVWWSVLEYFGAFLFFWSVVVGVVYGVWLVWEFFS